MESQMIVWEIWKRLNIFVMQIECKYIDVVINTNHMCKWMSLITVSALSPQDADLQTHRYVKRIHLWIFYHIHFLPYSLHQMWSEWLISVLFNQVFWLIVAIHILQIIKFSNIKIQVNTFNIKPISNKI